MLFSEFQQGTGCKDNAYNHQIYERLELMYMADDAITKEEIYEYGKKLVDNSKSEEEIKLEKRINEEISHYKAQMKKMQSLAESYDALLEKESNFVWKTIWKDHRNCYLNGVKMCRQKIAELKCVLV